MIVIQHRTCPDVILLRVVDRDTLDGLDLTDTYLAGAVMTRLRCRGTRFGKINLREADLREADLREADFGGAKLRGADLRGANLSGASLVAADLRGASLQQADLRGADLSQALLQAANLTGVRWDAQTLWPEGMDWEVEVGAQGDDREASGFVGQCRAVWVKAWLWQQSLGRTCPDAAPFSRRRRVGAPWLGGAGPAAVGTAVALFCLVALAEVNPERVPGLETAMSPAPRQSVQAGIPRVQVTTTLPLPERSRTLEYAHRPERQPALPRRSYHTFKYRRVARTWNIRSRPQSFAQLRGRDRVRSRQSAQSSGVRPDVRSHIRQNRLVLASHTVAVRRPQSYQFATPPEPQIGSATVSNRQRLRKMPRGSGRAIRYAWGNSGFHYGGGYDMYRMHMGGSE